MATITPPAISGADTGHDRFNVAVGPQYDCKGGKNAAVSIIAGKADGPFIGFGERSGSTLY